MVEYYDKIDLRGLNLEYKFKSINIDGIINYETWLTNVNPSNIFKKVEDYVKDSN